MQHSDIPCAGGKFLVMEILKNAQIRNSVKSVFMRLDVKTNEASHDNHRAARALQRPHPGKHGQTPGPDRQG